MSTVDGTRIANRFQICSLNRCSGNVRVQLTLRTPMIKNIENVKIAVAWVKILQIIHSRSCLKAIGIWRY